MASLDLVTPLINLRRLRHTISWALDTHDSQWVLDNYRHRVHNLMIGAEIHPSLRRIVTWASSGEHLLKTLDVAIWHEIGCPKIEWLHNDVELHKLHLEAHPIWTSPAAQVECPLSGPKAVGCIIEHDTAIAISLFAGVANAWLDTHEGFTGDTYHH